MSQDLQDLKRRSLSGGALTVASQLGAILIQLASTVILARLLSPQDYGLIAMVMTVTAFAGLFRDFGLSPAAIQRKDLAPDQQNCLFWLNVSIGALLTIVVAAAAPVVAWFFGEPKLVAVTVVLSTIFVLGSMGTQSSVALVRRMQFGRQAVATTVGALSSLVVSVAAAWHGLAYWALVLGNVVGTAVTTLLLLSLSPFRPSSLKWAANLGPMVRFGASVTAFDFVNYFQRNLDNVLIGKVWGADALGLYARAYQLLMLPINTIRGPISAVAFPAMSKLQNEPAALRDYFLKTSLLIAMLSMPMVAFAFVAVRPLIELLLGPKWLGVVPIFQWLAVAAFLQPTTSFAASLLLSRGEGRKYLLGGAVNAVVVSVAFVIGVMWGPTGVAVGYAAAGYMVVVPWLMYVFSGTPISFKSFANVCVAPILASTLGGIGSYLTLGYLGASPLLVQLCVAFAVLNAVSLAGLLCFTRSRVLLASIYHAAFRSLGGQR